MNYLVAAIQKLRPTAEFSFQDNDYSTIKWDILEGDAPTQAEVDEAIKIVKKEEAQAESQAIAARQSAETKLLALGLTVDDLKALGLA